MPTRSDSLLLVATGLRLVYVGLCLIILSGFAFGIMLGMKADPRTTLLLFFGGLVLGGALDIAGRLCCLAMPSDATSARPLIFISVIFTLVSLVIGAAELIGLWMPDLNPSQTIQNLSFPLSVIGSLLFLFFLRQVALYVGNQKWADRVWTILILGLIAAVGYGYKFVLALSAERVGDLGADGMIGTVAALIALVAFLLYANLLTYLSTDVRKFADKQLDEFEDEGM